MQVAYWPDGHFMTEISDAELADREEIFGPEKHKILEVPENSRDADIKLFVADELSVESKQLDGSEEYPDWENIRAAWIESSGCTDTAEGSRLLNDSFVSMHSDHIQTSCIFVQSFNGKTIKINISNFSICRLEENLGLVQRHAKSNPAISIYRTPQGWEMADQLEIEINT